MLHNKKGAALLQVLLVTVVLAGMATMLLRANLSRTTTARQTRQAISNQLLINTCQAEINALWSLKDPDVFAADLQNCLMFCNRTKKQTCESQNIKSYKCKPVTSEEVTYQVVATFTGAHPNANGQCDISYEVNTVPAGQTADYPTAGPEVDNNGNGNGNGNRFDPYADYYRRVRVERLEDAAAQADRSALETPSLDKEF